ncbi:DUF2778 domain-containing protein [Rhizobium sp. FY34]|uniref:DUF2778 domain-containing protein n=1 Tax=Rhizobium sp. FY34 TaxID=2562309 RepID=UPI0010C10EB8|nr:DUF2778 domain-containing protein [Rhizobium sp. FY34]
MALVFTAETSVSKNVRRQPKASASHGFLKGGVALGVALAVGGWMLGALVTMQTMGSAKPLDYGYQMRAALDLKPIAVSPRAERSLKIAKFSRLSSGATEKSGRLEDADFAHLSTRRPADPHVKDSLSAALAQAEIDRQFAALSQKRPAEDAWKTTLSAALHETVLIAPPTETAWDAALAGNAEGGEVEVADLQSPAELAVAEAIGPSTDDDLPEAGPLPMRRPPANAVALALAPSAARPVVSKPAARASAPVIAEDEEEEAPKALAFARPENPMKSMTPSVPWPDRGTKIAVYDITNGVVHMPNGEKLEAHSGIGEMRDNPKYTHVKMRGPTPPGTYKLSMREKLFHGVAAIRLTPTDGVAPLGRTGLLAHSYLLRVRGDSHGCVAFAEYDRFLKAFQRGDITHMIIVERHTGSIPAMALRKINPRGGGSSGSQSTPVTAENEGRRTLVDYLKNDG